MQSKKLVQDGKLARPARKGAMRVQTDGAIVGRGGLKIAEAAEAFGQLGFGFRDKVVLDVGSSTGGFTEYALKHGARKVVAIEKGKRQMKAPLRFDPRVELHEGVDVVDVRALPDTPDIIMIDVSFTSLRPILKHLRENMAESKTEVLAMLKPQFEARLEQLNRGVVKNERMRREICKDFEAWLKREGWLVKAKRDNETRGKVGGNIERFYYLV